MTEPTRKLSVLDYLLKQIAGTLEPTDDTTMRYPTATSRFLGFRVVDVGAGTAIVELDTDVSRHGNQQGTVQGGVLVELADEAIGTAHSTVVEPGESFTSIDLKSTFLRPVWNDRLTATAYATHRGRTVSHYQCDVTRADGKVVATVTSVVMTLRGEKAEGR